MNSKENLVDVEIEEYDYLLYKDKPDEGEDFKDIVHFDSLRKSSLWAEAVVGNLVLGATI